MEFVILTASYSYCPLLIWHYCHLPLLLRGKTGRKIPHRMSFPQKFHVRFYQWEKFAVDREDSQKEAAACCGQEIDVSLAARKWGDWKLLASRVLWKIAHGSADAAEIICNGFFVALVLPGFLKEASWPLLSPSFQQLNSPLVYSIGIKSIFLFKIPQAASVSLSDSVQFCCSLCFTPQTEIVFLTCFWDCSLWEC